MRVALVVAMLLGAQVGVAQSGDSVLTARTSLVVVPALVKTKAGAPVYTLTADQFLVTDDGVAQEVTLEEDSGAQPLALVIAVETGGSGARRLESYRELGPLLEAMVGGVTARVAVVGIDSESTVLQVFTGDMGAVEGAMHDLEAGDGGAAILDGLGYSVDLLKKQPAGYRRAILLISETVDVGSKLKLAEAVRAVSDTNTAIYSLAFSSSKDETKKALKDNVIHSSEDVDAGPPGGCMAQDPNKPVDPTQTKLKQAMDCAGVLLPPLLLVRAATEVAMNSMKKNVPETVAQLSGGEYIPFSNEKGVERGLAAFANHIPNRYVLSFHPVYPHAGLHTVTVKVVDNPEFVVTARSSYWSEDGAAVAR